jgi:ribosomal protein S18 acetylase RimI-like enzyme
VVFVIHELHLEKAPWQKIKQLLDQSYPLPPRDVFERIVQASHRPQRLWIATAPVGCALQGMVMLSPHSKGGHIENLAVAPVARGQGVGTALVQALLAEIAVDGPSIISLTTRIPRFFSAMGFQVVGTMGDASIAMVKLVLPAPIQPTRSITP